MNQLTKPTEGSVTWQTPSNIALVKYWGKHGVQLPINPSLSITLRQSTTTTEIKYQTGSDKLTVDFLFEGKPELSFGERIKKFLSAQISVYPVLKELHLKISSSNTFPHSSGIASSASAFSALSLCILSVVRKISPNQGERDFLEEASELARLGSGSAGRSIYAGYVVWGEMKEYKAYSDYFAVPVQTKIHPDFQDMQDAILIVNSGRKKVGSSAGHNLMAGHPYLKARIDQARKNMNDLHSVLSSGDQSRFIAIVENEALSLHGLMLASNPGYLLMEESTYKIIEDIRTFRSETGVPLCFTLDAGPNVHLLYPDKEKGRVKGFIKDHLIRYCSNGQWIDDGMGEGPRELQA